MINHFKPGIRILYSCTGIGVMNRGIESFFREAFDGLKDLEGIESRLISGSAIGSRYEKSIVYLSRFSKTAEMIGKATGRSSYAIEQLSSFPAIAHEIRKFRPHVIFSSEANLFFQLNRFRSWIGVPYRLLFSNGGPCEGPFHWTDFVHQVSHAYRDEAIQRGENPAKHIMVPYGIHVPAGNFIISPEDKRSLRSKLSLPPERRILISVGWISAFHKRMDYTIREVARMPEDQRPFLVLLGNIDGTSQEIMQLAADKLGDHNYTIRSVPYPEVKYYYMSADCFALSSLAEGFGRVFLEALMYNLPVVAHEHPVMQYVVGDAGILTDLRKDGNLSAALQKLLDGNSNKSSGREYVRKNFDWNILAPMYCNMFRKASEKIQDFTMSGHT